MVSGHETMRVEAHPGAEFLRAAEQFFRKCHVVLRGDLQISLFAGDRFDLQSGKLRHRHVIGHAFMAEFAMRGEDGIEPEALRRLRAQQAVARNGFPAATAFALQCVGNGQEWNGCVCAILQRQDHAVDQRARNQRPRRIVDQNEIRPLHRKRLQPVENGMAACIRARDGRKEFQPPGCRAIQIFMSCTNNGLRCDDVGAVRESVERAAKNGYAAQRLVLLGHGATGAGPRTGGNKEQCYARHVRQVAGQIAQGQRILGAGGWLAPSPYRCLECRQE